MKKLAILASVITLGLTAPVFACPGHDGDAPKTAEKTETPRTADTKTDKKAPEAKPVEKKTEAKPDTKTAKPEPKTDKKPDKVSIK